MGLCKTVFREYLKALLYGAEENIVKYMMQDTMLHMNMLKKASVANFPSSMKLTEDFQIRISTITNSMVIEAENRSILFATVHHLIAIDEKQQLYPFLFGGKYRFVMNRENKKIEEVWFDLEYVSGNTWLIKDKWIPLAKTRSNLPNEELMAGGGETIAGAIFRFLWGLDTCNGALAREFSATDIYIERAGVDGDSYGCSGIESLEDFMAEDKAYYSQNQYSIHIDTIEMSGENSATVTAYHLYPANTGNKHLGSHNKYTQFYNEMITLELERELSWKIKKIEFRRKENPVPYGYEVLEL